MNFVAPREPESQIAALSRRNLEATVAIDSQSDENSSAIPSSAGQLALAQHVGGFFTQTGAAVEHDPVGSVIATWPGRGTGAGKASLALMVHLDTSRGTQAVPRLELCERWDGRRIPYPQNPHLQVGIDTYPAAQEFLGQDILFGPGDAPFGLDDKLGLAHLMTLAQLLQSNPEIPHPPLLIIGRADEEIGRMAAVEGCAQLLADRGVTRGFTVDGILPYEVNVENFNASQASITFPSRPARPVPGPTARLARVKIGGVNTHGCTAKAEGFRAATRLAAEVLAQLRARGLAPDRILPLSFQSAALRDCDADVLFVVGGSDNAAATQAWGELERTLKAIVGPHVPRGASFSIAEPETWDRGSVPADAAACDMLRFVASFLSTPPGFVLAAEESEGREGYSNPYRALPIEGRRVRLDVRLRDFESAGLKARERHVERAARAEGLPAEAVTVTQQYVNMGPRLADHRELTEWPRAAAPDGGAGVRLLPIRGGTGVDPFLDRGIPIGNIGTGYFAPESEKEFTSLQMMAGHALWLTRLVQVAAS